MSREPAPSRSFVADVHLAKLARHLRMLGFDALWWPHAEDARLLEVARDEGRVLLTRDRALYESADPALRHYVRAVRSEEQLVEVLRDLGLAAATAMRPLSRCLDCNAPLRGIAREDARDRVPPGVLEAQAEFFACPGCGRIYWAGSHFDRMRDRIRLILERAREPG